MSNLLFAPIVGGLTSDRAHLWGRADGPGVLYAWLGQQPDLSDAQLVSRSLKLEAVNGFAGVAPLSKLTPDIHYHYTLTLEKTRPDPHAGPYPEFTTFPPQGQPESFAFAFGSCFRPVNQTSGGIFRALAARRQSDGLRFILMIGDQIYADDNRYNGISKIACTLDEYRAVYQHTWSCPAFRQLIPNLPAFMTLDDHEVDDDWRWKDHHRQLAAIPWWNQLWRWLKRFSLAERTIPRHRVLVALQAYWEHQAMHAPSMCSPFPLTHTGQYDLDASNGALAYTFYFGAAAFFVLDTRTHRVKGGHDRTMLGPAQWRTLETWLKAVKEAYPIKFIVTSCSLLHHLFIDFPGDRWSGFPEERNRLLSLLAYHGIEGVYLLAGDLHSAHAVRAELPGPQGKPLDVWEFCSSPFEQQINTAAGWAYDGRLFPPLTKLERKFCVMENNYGIVRVEYPPNQPPQVRFEVIGEQGNLIASAGE